MLETAPATTSPAAVASVVAAATPDQTAQPQTANVPSAARQPVTARSYESAGIFAASPAPKADAGAAAARAAANGSRTTVSIDPSVGMPTAARDGAAWAFTSQAPTDEFAFAPAGTIDWTHGITGVQGLPWTQGASRPQSVGASIPVFASAGQGIDWSGADAGSLQASGAPADHSARSVAPKGQVPVESKASSQVWTVGSALTLAWVAEPTTQSSDRRTAAEESADEDVLA